MRIIQLRVNTTNIYDPHKLVRSSPIHPLLSEFFYVSDDPRAKNVLIKSFEVLLEYPLNEETINGLLSHNWNDINFQVKTDKKQIDDRYKSKLFPNIFEKGVWAVYIPILDFKKRNDTTKIFMYYQSPRYHGAKKRYTRHPPIVHTKYRTYSSICQLCIRYAEHLAGLCVYTDTTPEGSSTGCSSLQFTLHKELL